MLWIAVVALIVVFGGLAYIRATLYFWVAFAVLVTFGFAVIDSIDLLPTLVSSVIAAILILLCITPLRRKFISNPLFLWFKKSLPKLSDTEQQALDAGTVWWDAELFSGKPDWRILLNAPKPGLSAEEQAFLDGPVDELVTMLDPWEVEQDRNLAENAWTFLREKGFFSMIIPKSYGGQCQTKTPGSAKTVMRPASGSKLTPFGRGGGAIEFEILAAVKVTLLVKMVVN